MILTGCQSGIKPLDKKQLNGKAKLQITTNVISKELELKIPAQTNVIKVDISKLEEGKNKVLEIKIVSEPIVYKLDIQEKSFNISSNFLILWYGTAFIVLGIFYLFWKYKKSKHSR